MHGVRSRRHTTENAEVVNRVRARPIACSPRTEGIGTGARCVATSGTDGAGGPKASDISEMRRTEKWHESLEEVVEEDYLLVEKTGRCSGGFVPDTKSLPWIGQTFCARCKN